MPTTLNGVVLHEHAIGAGVFVLRCRSRAHVCGMGGSCGSIGAGTSVVRGPVRHGVEGRHELEGLVSPEHGRRSSVVRDKAIGRAHDGKDRNGGGCPFGRYRGLIVVERAGTAPLRRGEELRHRGDDALDGEVVARVRREAVRQGGSVAVPDGVDVPGRALGAELGYYKSDEGALVGVGGALEVVPGAVVRALGTGVPAAFSLFAVRFEQKRR